MLTGTLVYYVTGRAPFPASQPARARENCRKSPGRPKSESWMDDRQWRRPMQRLRSDGGSRRGRGSGGLMEPRSLWWPVNNTAFHSQSCQGLLRAVGPPDFAPTRHHQRGADGGSIADPLLGAGTPWHWLDGRAEKVRSSLASNPVYRFSPDRARHPNFFCLHHRPRRPSDSSVTQTKQRREYT